MNLLTNYILFEDIVHDWVDIIINVLEKYWVTINDRHFQLFQKIAVMKT